MDNTVGEKIRRFRKRAGVSQFDLELQIDASPGSISRIESGQVNPTKETLGKIIHVLNLKMTEAASLYDLNMSELPNLVQLAKRLSRNLDLELVLQDAVNEIVYELNLLGSVILLCENDHIYAKAMTHTWSSKAILDVLPSPLLSLKAKVKPDSENYVIKTIIDKTPQYSTTFNNFCKEIIPDSLANFIQKINGTKCTICLPIEVDSEVLGAILFSKGIVDKFELEYEILREFAEHVGIAIINAKKYSNLEKEVHILKQQRTILF